MGKDDNNANRNTLFPKIISASIGSIITALAVTPLEVVKVRQQTLATTATKIVCPDHGATIIVNNGFMECVVSKSCFMNGCSAITKNEATLGTFATLRAVFQKEGLTGVYAGLTPTLIMSIPNTVLYFSAYDEISSKLRNYNYSSTWNNTFVPLVSGSTARIAATTVTSPFELIKTRQAAGASSVSDVIKDIIQKGDGFKSFYRGLLPTLLRDAPFSAVYWFSLEHFQSFLNQYYLKSIMKNDCHESNTNNAIPGYISLCNTFISGATSGMIAATLTTPFDVIKTRQQTSNEGGTTTRKLLWQFNHILKTEGFMNGLMRGNTTRVIKVAPACAIMISCYEFGKNVFSSESL